MINLIIVLYSIFDSFFQSVAVRDLGDESTRTPRAGARRDLQSRRNFHFNCDLGF
jgi:hypothetical protein